MLSRLKFPLLYIVTIEMWDGYFAERLMRSRSRPQLEKKGRYKGKDPF